MPTNAAVPSKGTHVTHADLGMVAIVDVSE